MHLDVLWFIFGDADEDPGGDVDRAISTAAVLQQRNGAMVQVRSM